MSIEELEHTADLRFRVGAPTLPELFAEATRALMLVMYGETSGPVTEARRVAVTAGDREALLRDYLSEVLWLAETGNLVFSAAELAVAEKPEPSVEGTLRGTPFDPARHAGGAGVKGISYCDLAIVEADEGLSLEVVFDV
ncbi:MAG: archease [Methanospirillum sp.]|nr:archease [Methanospirillum sp.]